MIVETPRYLLPSRKLLTTAMSFVAVIVTVGFLFQFLQLTPNSLEVDPGFVADVFHQFFPPNWSLLAAGSLWLSMLDTLGMAFLGTVVSGIIALLLAFLAASNTTPHPVIRLLVRTILAIQRSLPALIIILVLVVAVGIGPFAGVITLTLGSVGMFGKFFADSIEQADRGISESVDSLGSTRVQTTRYAVLPQVLPSFVANMFYAFDHNLRAAIPLGIFGGGGIGFELEFAHGLLHYHDVTTYTIMIVVMITLMERVSDWVRHGILSQPLLDRR